MSPVDGGFTTGPQTVNTIRYPQTLYLQNYSYGNSVDYQLGRRYHHFHAFVGLSDDSSSYDHAKFALDADGQMIGPTPTLGVGQTYTFDVDLPGPFRLRLEIDGQELVESGSAVWINPT